MLGNADTGPGGYRSVPECQKPPDSKVVVEDIATGAGAEGAGAEAGVGKEAETEASAAIIVGDSADIAADDVVSNSSVAPSVDSLVKFCRFLSLLVESAQQEEQTPLSATEKERAALEELLRARRVGHTI